MNETIAGGIFLLLGVGLGGFLTWISTRQERQERRKEEIYRSRVERQNRLEQQKVAAYVRFMVAGRQLRFIARRLMIHDKMHEENGVSFAEEIRARIEFHSARYEIHILAPKDSVESVDRFHDTIGNFLGTARQTPDSIELKKLRTDARHAQDELEKRFRAEIGVGDASLWHEESNYLNQ